ncbi:MAG: PA domain-containing protein, partial [Candidatus Neomarinimicrobiota bacterium]
PGGRDVSGEGHLHYYLDVAIPVNQHRLAVTAPGTYLATTETAVTWDNVSPGSHTLGVQLVNNSHTPLNPPVTAQVMLTLSAAEAPVGSSNLNVVGHLNIAAGPGHITDVWAHTAASGRSFAYLGSFGQPSCSPDITGVHIVDITHPENPIKVGFIPSPAGTRANDVKVGHIATPLFEGDVLIHSVETCGAGDVPPASAGIVIYDVTDPVLPKVLARDFLDFEVHNTFIYQSGESAFTLVVEDGADLALHILDITDPSLPTETSVTGWTDWFDIEADQLFLGTVPIPMLHDVWAQTLPGGSPDPAVAGQTIAYLSYWDAGLVLLDITDPALPVFLGDSDYLDPDPLSGQTPEGNSHVAVPTTDGELVFMGDEDFSAIRTVFSVATGNFTAEYGAAEGGFTVPIAEMAGQVMKGPTTFVGLACEAGAVPPPGAVALASGETHIALIERGVCPFEEKIINVAEAGYGGAVVFNTEDAAGQIMVMDGDTDKGVIPAVLVSRFTGFAILGISPESPAGTDLPPTGTAGQKVTARGGVVDGWGYGRILNVSDPADIVELGQFATENVLAFPVPPGDHSMHNVIVDGRRAYISWYADGIRVVDFSRPENPEEIARFLDTAAGSNFWGVYLFKHTNGESYILGSDRDSGLWILETP